MRIIGGRLGGRRIDPPGKNWPVRPTTDFAREALFNILDNRMEYDSVIALDLFGGTGINSFELASRGCLDITYVDRFRASGAYVRRMAKELGLPIQVVEGDVLTFLRKTKRQWDFIFADPPYDMPGLVTFPGFLLGLGVLRDKGLFVLEHGTRNDFRHTPAFLEARTYGQSVFSFFAPGS